MPVAVTLADALRHLRAITQRIEMLHHRLHTFGLRIPEDIAVVGFDDVPMAAAASFQLTSVRQDIEGLAAEAVDRLVERMSDPTRPARSQTLPVELVERRTCRR